MEGYGEIPWGGGETDHSPPIRLHGFELNLLNTGATSSFLILFIYVYFRKKINT
jgi:hypothetical protein